MRNSNRIILSAVYLSSLLFALPSNANQTDAVPMASEEQHELRKEALELIKDNGIAHGNKVLFIAEDPQTHKVLSTMPLKEMGKKQVSSPWGNMQSLFNYGHETASWAYNKAYDAGKYAYDNSPTVVQKGVDAAYNAGKHTYDTVSSTMLYAGEQIYKFSKEHPYIATTIAAGAICIVVASGVYLIDGGGTIQGISLLTGSAAAAETSMINELQSRMAQVASHDPSVAVEVIQSFAEKHGFNFGSTLVGYIQNYDPKNAGAFMYNFAQQNLSTSYGPPMNAARAFWDIVASYYK